MYEALCSLWLGRHSSPSSYKEMNSLLNYHFDQIKKSLQVFPMMKEVKRKSSQLYFCYND